ncbi:hypothetical protein GPECTOR_24g257 [Gonium pectorale]|uniref:F-box domain-containing protein n=1 Tax=Gonium pectorale TaxID=33097 RepID=A0A150GGJ1_GONPE|nr:hypothetical protein GPECTOR_24g257 [Gonium pectorale]|eukprot:KXZ48967.1 hypothetical protein GPECTOR_24g257 [Gonium pectorale]
MQTRRRAKADAAAACASGSACWLPTELQLRILDIALADYATPVFRSGLVANPARHVLDLMLVCREWHRHAAGHPHTCRRQASATCLRVAWLTDVALLAGIGGVPKRTKLNRIPATVRLLLPYEDTVQRTAFERDSFPDRVPLLAIDAAAPLQPVPVGMVPVAVAAAQAAAIDAAAMAQPLAPGTLPAAVAPAAAGLTAAELHWLARVVCGLDAEFLSPLVLRISLALLPAAGGQQGGGGGGGGEASSGGVGAGGGAGGCVEGGLPAAALSRADVEALRSPTLAVGSDDGGGGGQRLPRASRYLYLVPTAATLRHSWGAQPGA